MAHYPVSVLDGSAAQAFGEVLTFHLPPASKILDPTFGQGHLWDARVMSDYEVTKSDILPSYNQDLFSLADDHPEYIEYFDGVIYDPPYLIDVQRSNDPRSSDYGNYHHTEDDLRRFMTAVANPLKYLIKPGGKIIVKCSDQYINITRKLHLWHVDWLLAMQRGGYTIVDLFIQRYHRVSPTAYQVKNRPSNIIAHSYLLVGQKET